MVEPASDADPPIADMSAADDSTDEGETFSWLDPHPIFAIILVGPEETPFGIHKDFLCAKCGHFRDYFRKGVGEERTVQHVLRLADTSVEVFAHAQHFLYTGNVFPDPDRIPGYDVLVDIWKLGHKFDIEGLCERALEAMCERKRVTQTIPATPLLLQVWKDTPEGATIRQLLLSWAAEYLRSSDERSVFARQLPKELLSELVIAMSACDTTWVNALPAGDAPQSGNATASASTSVSIRANNRASTSGHASRSRGKHVRVSDAEDSDEAGVRTGNSIVAVRPLPTKRARYSDPGVVDKKTVPKTEGSSSSSWGGRRTSLTRNPKVPKAPKVPKKRTQTAEGDVFSTSQKLRFCSALLTRMLSGPGFWTRLVGPFRDPVDPETAGVPDYLTKIKRPMDLSTVKANLDAGKYATPEEFLGDMRQIFTNAYTYWKKGDPIWNMCERLEKTFEQKYATMNKWLVKEDAEDLY